jgi:membrane protein
MDDRLRSATPPLAPLPFLRWLWQLTKDVVNEYRRDGVGDLAASITFWTIISIPAAVLALVSALSSLESIVGASVSNDVQVEVETFITDTFADSEALNSTVTDLFESSSAGIATLAAFVALFTLSRAFAGLIRALDRAYEVVDGRPWWYVRIVAIGLGISTIVVVAAGATLLAVLPSLPLGSVLRWLTAPAVVLALVAWAATLFHVGPNHRTPWRYDLPGAIVTTLGWILASQGFALYVRLAGGGNDVQTGVGAILLALSLMYVLSIVLLVGAELNDVLARRAGVVQQTESITSRARGWRDGWRDRRSRPAPDVD